MISVIDAEIEENPADNSEELFFAPEEEISRQQEEVEEFISPSGLNEELRSWKILVVDDEADVHTVTGMLLENVSFAGKPVEIIDAYSASEARDILDKQDDIALIFLDVVMETNQAGLELVKYLREELKNKRTRIILRTGQPGEAPESRVILEYEIEDYKLKTELTAQKMITSLIGGLRAYSYLRKLEIEYHKRSSAENLLAEAYAKLDNVFEQTVESLTALMEIRDEYTAGHARRVGLLAEKIAEEMKLSPERCRLLRLAGYLHDIGKNKIPLQVLNKIDELSEDDWQLILEHPETGYNILKNIDYPWPLAEIVRQHHERINGEGYPHKLKGEQIHLEAQIMGIADLVDATMLARPYRPALSREKVLSEIIRQRGSGFATEVVDACLSVFKNYEFNENQ